MIILTDNAATEIKRLQKSRNQTETYLDISIKKGGCQDWYYDLNLIPVVEEETFGDRQLILEKEIRIAQKEENQGYFQELTIDYLEDLMGGGFRFENNKVIKTCNCGQSFSLKKT